MGYWGLAQKMQRRPVRSRSLQVSGGQVDAVLAECRRRPDQRIGSLDRQFRREPRPLKDPYLGPLRRDPIVLRGQMLRESGQKHVPPLIASSGRLVTEQRGC